MIVLQVNTFAAQKVLREGEKLAMNKLSAKEQKSLEDRLMLGIGVTRLLAYEVLDKFLKKRMK